MRKKKSPFVSYSIEEVNKMETNYFCLQFGDDFISDNGYLFTGKEMEKIYDRTMNNLLDVIEEGTEKDRRHAMELMCGLFVVPFRLH